MSKEQGQNRGRRFETIAMTVRNRQGGRCRKCGEPEGGERLSVHHIVPDSEIPEQFDAHLPVNLVALCRPCHSELESKPLGYQLRKLGIENREELLLADSEREKLNKRLVNIGPNALTTKKVSKQASEEFLEQDFVTIGEQTSLSDY